MPGEEERKKSRKERKWRPFNGTRHFRELTVTGSHFPASPATNKEEMLVMRRESVRNAGSCHQGTYSLWRISQSIMNSYFMIDEKPQSNFLFFLFSWPDHQMMTLCV